MKMENGSFGIKKAPLFCHFTGRREVLPVFASVIIQCQPNLRKAPVMERFAGRLCLADGIHVAGEVQHLVGEAPFVEIASDSIPCQSVNILSHYLTILYYFFSLYKAEFFKSCANNNTNINQNHN